MEQWTKLYERILKSSVWKLPSDERIVWITLIALKDKDGCVYGSAEWLADQAIVSDEACVTALGKFLGPDKRSRTPDNEGRKVEQIEGGWRILNHHLYRDGIEDQREKWARQKAAQRAREKLIVEKMEGRKFSSPQECAEELRKLHGMKDGDDLDDPLTAEQRIGIVRLRIANEEALEERMKSERKDRMLDKSGATTEELSQHSDSCLPDEQ